MTSERHFLFIFILSVGKFYNKDKPAFITGHSDSQEHQFELLESFAPFW